MEQLKEANKDGFVDVLQGEYNLLNREAESTFFPYIMENNISFVPFFPLVSGLLAGKYTEDTTFPEGDLRREQENFQGDLFKENIKKVNQLAPIAEKHNVGIAHVVLAWYLARPEINILIPGAKRAEQLKDNMKTANVELTKEDISFIDELFA